MTYAKCLVNSVEVPLLSADVTKNGDRTITTARFGFKPDASISQSDTIEYLHDCCDLANLQAIWHFEGIINDDSGNNRDLTANGSPSYTAGKYGKAITLDGSDSQYLSLTEIQLSGAFTLHVWQKRTDSTGIDTLFGRNADTVSSYSKIQWLTDNKLSIRLVENTLNSEIDVGYTNALNGTWALITIKRDSSNNIYVKVNNGDWIFHSNQGGTFRFDRIGRNKDNGEGFLGAFDTIRIYDVEQSDTDVTQIYRLVYNITTIKFAGKITGINNEVSPKIAEAESFGKALKTTRVENVVFTNQSPEAIMKSILENNTTLIWTNLATASGITYAKYVADGFLIDLFSRLASVNGETFRTDGHDNFILEDLAQTTISMTLRHGTNCVVTKKGDSKDTELCNEVTVLGQVLEYNKVETFNGTGAQTVFTLAKPPKSMRVTLSTVEQTPGTQYSFDTEGKTVTFVTAPPIGVNNVSIDYVYEDPIYVRRRSEASIEQHGRYDKRFVLPWIRTEADALLFAGTYISLYSVVRTQLEIVLPTLMNDLEENVVITVRDTATSGTPISGTYVVKSIQYLYPTFRTIIQVGEYHFDAFEAEKFIIQKLHDLEAMVTTVKETNLYDSVGDTMTFTEAVDTVLVTDSVSDTVTFTEAVNATTVSDLEYDVGSYDEDVYG